MKREHRIHRRVNILQVISGGQTGADQAGLQAARDCGIPTGGWLPNSCLTLDGARRDFLELYGMREHEAPGYPPRTEANVADGDVTLRFARDFTTAGEACTARYIKQYRKPSHDTLITDRMDEEEVVDSIADFIMLSNPRVINIAGNSEKTAPGIHIVVRTLLVLVFKKLKQGVFRNA